MVQSTIINTIKDVTIAGLGSGGGGIEPSSINVGVINQNTGHMPTQRPDGTALKEGDWVSVDAGAVVPFTITYTTQGVTETITVTSISDRYYYNVTSAKWYKIAGAITETKELVVTNPATESITGNANFQNIINNEIKTEFQELPTKTLTFANKTIDAEDNTISNIERNNFKTDLVTDYIENHPYIYIWRCDDEEELAHYWLATKTINVSDEPQTVYALSWNDDEVISIGSLIYYGIISEISYNKLRLSIDFDDGETKTYHRIQELDQYVCYKSITSTKFVLDALKTSDSIIDVQTLPVSDINDKKIYRTKENTPIQMEKLWIYNRISNLFLSISRIVISQENYNLLTEQQKNDGTAYILPNGQSIITLSYNNLPDKPKINSITLQDNLTSEDLNMYTRQEVDSLIQQHDTGSLQTYRISDMFITNNTVISVTEFTKDIHKCYVYNGILYVDLYFNSTNSISLTGFKTLMTFTGGTEYEFLPEAQLNEEITRGTASMYNSGEYINTELSCKASSSTECDVSIFYTNSMLNKTGGLNVHLKMFVKKK